MPTKPLNVILCPVDFSEPAELALHYARDIAACSGATLVAIYADRFLPPPHFTARQVEELVQELDDSRIAAQRHLAQFLQEHVGAAVKTEAIVAENLPVPAILTTAREKAADMIVMGTHGRSGLSRMMLGSVTERVLREADRPVLSVRVKAGSATAKKFEVKQVLCPVTLSEPSLAALEYAINVAGCFNAGLTVLHVIEKTTTPTTSVEKARQQLCTWIPDGLHSRCQIHEEVRFGNAAEQIVVAAAEMYCDLIVLGARHQRFTDTTVLGTTTVRVTRHAPCPVLTVLV